MVRTIQYAARHNPEVVIFESVTGAYSLGREFMLERRADLEALTGERYALCHWLHDSIALGTPTSRKRYFFVAVRGDDPFVVQPAEEYTVAEAATVQEAIGDLEGLVLTMKEQPILHPERGGAWAADRRRFDGYVDGHQNEPSVHSQRIAEICRVLEEKGTTWYQGWSFTRAMQELYSRGGRDAVVQSLMRDDEVLDRLIGREFNVGAFGARREVYDAACSLITGSGPAAHVHSVEGRAFTYRELARIQGWPDDLRIDFDEDVYGKEHIGAVWGKAVGCLVAEHAGHAVREWIEGDRVGKTPGELIGDREWLIDDLPASRHLRRASMTTKRSARNAADAAVAGVG